MCQRLAAAACLWVEHYHERHIPFRQVECSGRCQWHSGGVQWAPPLYLLRRYGPRSNHWRRVWWHLACRHAELDVGTRRTALVQVCREGGPLGTFSLRTPPRSSDRSVLVSFFASSSFFRVCVAVLGRMLRPFARR